MDVKRVRVEVVDCSHGIFSNARYSEGRQAWLNLSFPIKIDQQFTYMFYTRRLQRPGPNIINQQKP